MNYFPGAAFGPMIYVLAGMFVLPRRASDSSSHGASCGPVMRMM